MSLEDKMINLIKIIRFSIRYKLTTFEKNIDLYNYLLYIKFKNLNLLIFLINLKNYLIYSF